MAKLGSSRVRVVIGLVCVLVVVVCSAAVALAASSRAATYTSSASVLYGPESSDRLLGSSSSTGDVERTLATQAQVVLGDTVMTAASAELGVSVTRLTRTTLVENLPDSNVLRISVTAPSASTAARRAQAVADLYVTNAKDQAQSRFASQAAALDGPIAELRSIINQSGSPNGRNATAINAALTSLLQQQLQLQAAAQSETGPAQVLATAIAPTDPSSIAPLTGAVVGAGIGIVVVIGALMVLFWWSRRGTPGPRALTRG